MSEPPTRKITSSMAQKEHLGLREFKAYAAQHKSDHWRMCPACRNRYRRMSVWVDGKPVT